MRHKLYREAVAAGRKTMPAAKKEVNKTTPSASDDSTSATSNSASATVVVSSAEKDEAPEESVSEDKLTKEPEENLTQLAEIGESCSRLVVVL